jgi:DNA mismatch repair protein MutS2
MPSAAPAAIPSLPAAEPDIAAETLELLEWPRLAEHLAGFAGTKAGRRHCRRLPLPASTAESLSLLAERSESPLPCSLTHRIRQEAIY